MVKLRVVLLVPANSRMIIWFFSDQPLIDSKFRIIKFKLFDLRIPLFKFIP